MLMKVRLYTCQAGLDLWKRGRAFGVWEKDSASFKEAVAEGESNIKIEVDSYDIKGNGQEDEYDIVAGANIKIIEEVIE